MKKTLKSIISVALALSFVLCSGAPAFAANTPESTPVSLETIDKNENNANIPEETDTVFAVDTPELPLIPLETGNMQESNTNVLEETDATFTSVDEIQPRGFSRSYSRNFKRNSSNVVDIVSDPNWDIWEDSEVTVKLTNVPEGGNNAKIRIKVYQSEDKEYSWEQVGGAYDLTLDDSHSWTIKKGYTFKVCGTWGQGPSGSYTFNVTLS